MNNFREIKPTEISGNLIDRISNQWMLVTAQKGEAINTMTASWGSIGFLWKKPVTEIYVRPQRYTLEFIDASDTFSLCFFNDAHRKTLSICGTKSGRDTDKIKECGLTVAHAESTPYFEEAELVVICKKLYSSTINPAMLLDKSVDEENYPQKDYHRHFISEIIKVLVKE